MKVFRFYPCTEIWKISFEQGIERHSSLVSHDCARHSLDTCVECCLFAQRSSRTSVQIDEVLHTFLLLASKWSQEAELTPNANLIMSDLLSMGLFWFFLLAQFFTFYMLRTSRSWGGANKVIPVIMEFIASICSIALIVLLVFIFIRISPWWYGLVMIIAGIIIPPLLPTGKIGEIYVALVGMIGAPLFVVLSFLKVFAVF